MVYHVTARCALIIICRYQAVATVCCRQERSSKVSLPSPGLCYIHMYALKPVFAMCARILRVLEVLEVSA